PLPVARLRVLRTGDRGPCGLDRSGGVEHEPWSGPGAPGHLVVGDGDFTDAGSVEEIPTSLEGSTYLTVWHGGYPLDLYVENRGAETTLVSFHAALGSSNLKPPVFTGRAIS